MYPLKDPIAAIATPPGEGGVAIVRLSGPGAIDIADKIFSGPVRSYKSHTLHFGRMLDREGRTVDEGLLVVMEQGRSYTGDETVEIHGHGGAVARAVLEELFRAGARAALPGEFTYRAYMNGRLDLAQAEAVGALIGARGVSAALAATQQLEGRLSETVRFFQRALIEVASILEAWVDFPEEGLEFASLDSLIGDLERVCQQMQDLAATFDRGRLLVDGARVCLVGAPNVGKSSLLNALLRTERAIVTPHPGTTRDLVEDTFNLSGFSLRLVDTAGLRETSDSIELEGIRRSKEAMASADLSLLILDATRGVTPEERELVESLPRDPLVVWNKTDLADPEGWEGVAVSARTGAGVDQLVGQIAQRLGTTYVGGEVTLTAQRHVQALTGAIAHTKQVIEGLQGDLSPEFLCVDLRAALHALGQILGMDVTEEVLRSIFSKFCIGK